MAHRGEDTLRFGPMKPVGLKDPRTGRQPYAAVQLRQDNLAGDHYSLVGFQTQLKWGEQARVLRMIPGLEQAEFVRFGMVHRNTYINGPTVLHETWQTRANPSLFFAGQISGVEGYVESAASGLIAGRNAAALARGQALRVPPRTTAIGALAFYVSHANPHDYQPTNITFGIMEPPPGQHPRQAEAQARDFGARAGGSRGVATRSRRGAESESGSSRGSAALRQAGTRPAHEGHPQGLPSASPAARRLAPHGDGVRERRRHVSEAHVADSAEAVRRARVPPTSMRSPFARSSASSTSSGSLRLRRRASSRLSGRS